MSSLLSLSRLIDRLNERVGHAFYWLVLVTVLISAANAVVRKLFNYSSNGLLEIQWYFFSAIFLFLAAFSWIVDVKGHKKWAFPLVVIGMNSIAAYMIAHLFEKFIVDSFRIHLGASAFQFFGTGVEPLIRGIALLLVYWLFLFWMYRRKLFLRV